MHPALQVPEILLDIFALLTESAHLFALTRTCRTFKEPALDTLWETLPNPSPLARCLPRASYYQVTYMSVKLYTFHRSLTEIEWGILRSYTRRIRSILDDGYGLDWESVRIFLRPPTGEPLFPGLRHLYCRRLSTVKLAFYSPLLALNSLWIESIDTHNPLVCRWFLTSLSEHSPNIRTLQAELNQDDTKLSDFMSSLLCRWQELQVVILDDITLRANALAHLSHTITRLKFVLGPTLLDHIAPSETPLSFTDLHELRINSKSLDCITRLLSLIWLPSLAHFGFCVTNRPSKLDLAPFKFWAGVRTCGANQTIQQLRLLQDSPLDTTSDAVKPTLGLEDLEPCAAFGNLCTIDIDIQWAVDLTDSHLLALVSRWPRLESLLINSLWGWNTTRGITPNGVLQVLQTCRSLIAIAIAVDTRGYTEFSPSSASVGLTLPSKFSINVIDSAIEEESVPAIAAFFADILPRPDFTLHAWDSWHRGPAEYVARWSDVRQQVSDAIKQRCLAPS